jgi:hypothetical protein
VRVVQVAVNKVIDVVAVRNCFMAAARPVTVVLFVCAAVVAGRTVGGVGVRDSKCMLLDGGTARMMEVAIVKVIGMVLVADSLVATARPVLVVVSFVRVRHKSSPTWEIVDRASFGSYAMLIY